MANRPDITIKNKRYKTYIQYVAIVAVRNVMQKKSGKKLKCKILFIEIQHM